MARISLHLFRTSVIELLEHFQTYEYMKCQRILRLCSVKISQISWSKNTLIPPNGSFSLIVEFSVVSSLLNNFPPLSLMILFLLKNSKLLIMFPRHIEKCRPCAHLAPAQFPPRRALQNIHQLCFIRLLCTVSPPKYSITLRILFEFVIILVRPPGTFSSEFDLKFRCALIALAHIVLNTLF